MLRPPLVVLAAFLCASAHAEQFHPPLRPLAIESLTPLGPLLTGAELALIESDAKGAQRQITTITLAKAAPAVMREVVIHPERYGGFVRNMTHSEVRPAPVASAPGTSPAPAAPAAIDHHWKLSYKIASFSGVNRYTFPEKEPAEAAAPVEMIDPTGQSHYRWQFLEPASGGGTIVVLYGYTDVKHSGGFLDRVLQRAATLEHGLALTTQLTLLLALKAQAERDPGTFRVYQRPTRLPDFRFLLDRGLVAVLHRAGGRLSDVSLVQRTPAQPTAVLDGALHVERWHEFVPTITRSDPRSADHDLSVVELEQSIPLMSWTAQLGMRSSKGAVDAFGLSGDLSGARLRWDAEARPRGTEVVLRTQLHYDRGSTIMRELFKIEPLFEYGVNVGLSLVILRAVAERAEAAPPKAPTAETETAR
jgi:hypothetical protein